MKRCLLFLLSIFPLLAYGEEPAAEETAKSEAPKVQKLGDGKYQIGLVTIDEQTRSLRFPATVNMTEGKLEFAIVHENGKIHESLLHTKTDALNLNVGLKLLRYQASDELFVILDEDYRPTGAYPDTPEGIKQAARLDFFIEWNAEDGTKKKESINSMILHTTSGKPLPNSTPWTYGGSYIHNGAFQAKAQGEIAAIFTSRLCLFNLPHEEHELDDVWEPYPKNVPPVGTEVTVILKPHSPAAK